MTTPDNPSFQIQAANLETLRVSQEPIHPDDLLAALAELEQTGSSEITAGTLDVTAFTAVAAGAYAAVSELRIEPPLSEEQREAVAGRLMLHTVLSDMAGRVGEGAERTDLNQTKTDGRKGGKQ